MQEGKVKFYNESKGFGFIKPNDGSADIFFHVSGVKEDVKDNDPVVYDVEQGKKGLIAVNIRLA